MRSRHLRWFGGLLALLPGGCQLFENAHRNVYNEFTVFCTTHVLRHQLDKEAARVWAEICRQHPGAFSDDYRDGFLVGYADYLEWGGRGEPIPVPPIFYRQHQYLSPLGQATIEEYITGFRYGTMVAIATGKRPSLIVPVLLPVEPQTGPPPRRPTDEPPTDAQPLPPPKPVIAPTPTEPPKPDVGAPKP
jgi:hypothetical protein